MMSTLLPQSIVLGSFVGVYLLFRAKQLVCDFYLQNNWMVHGKALDQAWHLPLATHAGIHAGGTLLIVLTVAPALWWLAPLDFVIHGVVDRIKAMKSLGGRYSIEQSAFWHVFGLDQEAHNLTHLAFVVVIVLRLTATAAA